MPAGLQVINDFGTIQIDSEWQNYALVDVQTVTSVQNAQLFPGAFFRGSIYTNSFESDLVFAHCASPFSIVGTSYVNSQRRVGVATRNTVGIPVTFYSFRKQPIQASTFGLQVFNAAGELTFDAASKFAKIVRVLSASQVFNGSGTISLPANRKYAVCIPSFCGISRSDYSQNTGGGLDYWQNFYGEAPVLRLTSASVSSSPLEQWLFFQVPSANRGASTYYVSNWVQALVADVTGF